MNELLLDSYLDTIYLQEDIRALLGKIKKPSITKKIESAIKTRNLKRIISSFKIIPAVPPQRVVSLARRKLRGFDIKYRELSRKYSIYDRPEEEIQLMAVAEAAKENLNDAINTVEDIDIEVPDLKKTDLSTQKFFEDQADQTAKQGGMMVGVFSILSVLAWLFAGFLGVVFATAASFTGAGAVFLLAVALIFLAFSSMIWFVKQLKMTGLEDEEDI
jgi:hypothetical protein